MSMNFGLIIEGLVSVLLLLTIGYCMVLNHRLKQLRSDESVLRHTIAELTAASIRAENAISGLKVAAGETENYLSAQTREAQEVSQLLAQYVDEGGDIISRLAAITKAAGPGKASAEHRLESGAGQSKYRVRSVSRERAA